MHVYNPITGSCTCGYVHYTNGGDKCEICGAGTSIVKMLGRAVYNPTHVLVEPDRIRLAKERLKEQESIRQDVRVESITVGEFIDILSPKERPEFRAVYMQLATILSTRSTCSRRQVGTVIVSEDYRRVLSVGYNGNASGLPNCCDNPETSGACGCLHAEENAAISCSEPRATSKIVFTTTYPCKMCAKRIVQLGGVIKVYYMEDYHDVEAEYVFGVVGIETERIVFESGNDENTF